MCPWSHSMGTGARCLPSPQAWPASEVSSLLFTSSPPPARSWCREQTSALAPSKPPSKSLLAHFPPSTTAPARVTLVSPTCAGHSCFGQNNPLLVLERVIGCPPY